ncbi:RTA1-domain-containing protein [Mycena venus]|uniref:RTA1-domain-containing protein n=1 Tax=Mycena venus TaxID=2733690 RepID=A0A8H6Y3H9_9AGAR|nr:RTA1-domain-containing protein [Mycena venus]
MSPSRPMAILRALFLVLLLAFSVVEAAPKKTLPRPSDPFADPKHDPYNPLRYIASNVLTAIAFALVLLVAIIQTVLVRKFGAKFMLSMIIGAYTFAFGIYIIEYLFVVLSPCAFIASEYVLLGRLARYLNCDKHLMVNPRRITIVFISSDITTFLVQAAGGSVSISSNTLSLAKVGSNIFLAGLVMQLASFLTFTCIFTVFIYRVRTQEPEVWAMHASKKWHQSWLALAGAMTFSFVGILIRSTYRVAELSQGYEGYLATTERFFYGLDTLPLFIAISIYVFFWPGRIIGNGMPPTATPVMKEQSSIDSVPTEQKET